MALQLLFRVSLSAGPTYSCFCRFALVHCFCVLMLQRGSGHKTLREIRGVVGGVRHHKQVSSGSAVAEAAKQSLGASSGPAQGTAKLCNAARCNAVSEAIHCTKRWVTEDNFKWRFQPKRKQKVHQGRAKILGGTTRDCSKKKKPEIGTCTFL